MEEMMETKVIKATTHEVSPQLQQVMNLVANGLSLVEAVRKIRGVCHVAVTESKRSQTTDSGKNTGTVEIHGGGKPRSRSGSSAMAGDYRRGPKRD